MQVKLRNVSNKPERFRISNGKQRSRVQAAPSSTPTDTSTLTDSEGLYRGSSNIALSNANANSSSGGVRAVLKPRGALPAGLTCEIAVELTPGQDAVSAHEIAFAFVVLPLSTCNEISCTKVHVLGV